MIWKNDYKKKNKIILVVKELEEEAREKNEGMIFSTSARIRSAV